MFFGLKRPSNDHYKRVLHSAIKPGLLFKFNLAKVLAMATRKGIREMEKSIWENGEPSKR